MSESVLDVSGLGVSFGTVRALEAVHFEVGAGELIAVLGPNGAGKSTLFRAVAGLVPHDGRVTIGGVDCHHRLDRMSAAFIPQRADVDLTFPISVAQLVATGRRRFGRSGLGSTRLHRPATMEALERVGLGGLADRSIGSLSGGQAQRAFLARALAQEAHLVMLDEALSGVDQPSTESLLDLFGELARLGTALLVATHDLGLARRRFDRCLALNGTLVADGVPEHVLDDRRVERIFGPRPSPSHI
ncbi:MAG: metal ABC transporter ATP-binding protein [Acidimicrobiia bacterium]